MTPTPEQLALARQLAALPGFRWRRRMSAVWSQLPEHGGHRMTLDAVDGRAYDDPWFNPVLGRWNCDGPDLTDDATGGVLLGWLSGMGALPDVCRDETHWIVDYHGSATRYAGNTLAEACARALIAVGRCS